MMDDNDKTQPNNADTASLTCRGCEFSITKCPSWCPVLVTLRDLPRR